VRHGLNGKANVSEISYNTVIHLAPTQNTETLTFTRQ
jgi:hypothetical protein